MADPRAEAVRILRKCSEKRANLDWLWQSTSFLSLSVLDQRLAKELVTGVFRQLNCLDFYINSLSNRPVSRIDKSVLWVLRVSIYQILFTRVPDYAVLDQAGKLVRRFKKSSAHSFVNGVLRALLRGVPDLPEGVSCQALSIRYSHPEWLVGRYIARFGAEITERVLQYNNQVPEAVVWVNNFKISREAFLEELRGEEIGCEALPGVPGCVRIEANGFARHRLYREGYCFFMDLSSQKVVQLCDLEKCSRIGDLCGAPGGKAFLMASRVGPSTKILCADLSYSRLEQTRSRADHYGIRQLAFLQMDLRKPALETQLFDFLLLDVPCSGSGTLRSNPDLRWRLREEDLAGMQDLQITLLRNAFALLKPGGALVYSTCSTEPEENEEVVGELLASEKTAELEAEYLKTFPEQEMGDGFFAARVRRL